MRICAFILIFTLGFANLTLARRLPPKNVKGGLFNLQAFRSAPFTIYCLSGFVSFLGWYRLFQLHSWIFIDFNLYLQVYTLY
jgi:hypothetical protein